MLYPLLGLLVLLVGAALLERQTLPRPPRWRRPWLAWGSFFLLGCSWYGLLLGLTGRVLMALALALAGALALTWVSNAKYRLLREPLVFSDFALVPQVIRHPRLYYVELVQQARTWLLLAPLLGLMLLWLWLEPSPLSPTERILLLIAPTALLIAVPFLPLIGTLVRQAAARHLPDPDPAGGIEKLGLAGSLLLSFLRWLETRPTAAEEAFPLPSIKDCGKRSAPLVVAVQSESFLDLRRLREDAPPLPNIAAAQARAAAWGPLRVPAIGAYTMRTEYAFLTGTPSARLGFDALDPYLRADTYPLPALPGRLSQAGWQTLFVHPHVGDFFRRNKVMPALGFERMITEEAFHGAERIGPYVSDAALTSEILRQLERETRPCFLFTVTMENHGPWRPGRLPGLVQETEIYGQHLLHADAMVGRLLSALESSGRPWALCFYGDHPPILRSIGDPAPDHRTDYLIVTSRDCPCDGPEEIDAAELGRRFLRYLAGFAPAEAVLSQN
ncbi:MAG TPA: LTA synthase family protein [Kiloniellales bacterium]|jgi:hypothetical protein|nr:LTA synthase family protein [Kiloniellales bacterium]